MLKIVKIRMSVEGNLNGIRLVDLVKDLFGVYCR